MVCVWIGNSRVIAREHNFQVTDEHFRQAAQNPAHEAKKTTPYPITSHGIQVSENPQENPENKDFAIRGLEGRAQKRKKWAAEDLNL